MKEKAVRYCFALLLALLAISVSTHNASDAAATNAQTLDQYCLDGTYIEQGHADARKAEFLKRLAQRYQAFDGPATPALRQQMSLFAVDSETIAQGFERLAQDESALARARNRIAEEAGQRGCSVR